MDHSVMTGLFISCFLYSVLVGFHEVSGKCAGNWNKLSCVQGNGKRENVPPSPLIDSKSNEDVDPSSIEDFTSEIPVATNAPSQQDLSKPDVKTGTKDGSKQQKILRQTLIQLLLMELEEDSS